MGNNENTPDRGALKAMSMGAGVNVGGDNGDNEQPVIEKLLEGLQDRDKQLVRLVGFMMKDEKKREEILKFVEK